MDLEVGNGTNRNVVPELMIGTMADIDESKAGASLQLEPGLLELLLTNGLIYVVFTSTSDLDRGYQQRSLI